MDEWGGRLVGRIADLVTVYERRTQEQIKIAEALLGSLNDIFCAISDLKGDKMGTEDTGRGVTTEKEQKQADDHHLATLQASIEQQRKLILGLQNDITAVKADIAALRASRSPAPDP